MAYSIYVCDTETTGVDPVKHDVIEVCFWRLNEEESKTWCVKPKNFEDIDDAALKINKHKREDITHATARGKEIYRPAEEVLPEIEMWIMEDGVASEDRVFVGQNPQFDYDFLLGLWRKAEAEDQFPFGYWIDRAEGRRNVGYLIDTIQLAKFVDLCTGKKRPKYNLGSLVKDFGVTKAQAHRADGDVKMTRDLFLRFMDPMKDLIIEKFSGYYPE